MGRDIRFCKEAVLTHIALRLARLVDRHHFDPENGTSQLEDGGIERAVAYGEVEALRDLMDSIEWGQLETPE